MGEVVNLSFKEKRQELKRCGGCNEPVKDNEEYTGVILPFDDYDKHILLCGSCAAESRKQGIL